MIPVLDELADARVVLREGSTFLGLAIPTAGVPPASPFQRKWVVAG